MVLLKEKYIDSKINLIVFINSSFGIAVLRSIKFHLFKIPSYTNSNGTLVKRDTTSKEAKMQPESIIFPFSFLTNLKLLPTELAASETLHFIMLCKNHANSYKTFQGENNYP